MNRTCYCCGAPELDRRSVAIQHGNGKAGIEQELVEIESLTTQASFHTQRLRTNCSFQPSLSKVCLVQSALLNIILWFRCLVHSISDFQLDSLIWRCTLADLKQIRIDLVHVVNRYCRQISPAEAIDDFEASRKSIHRAYTNLYESVYLPGVLYSSRLLQYQLPGTGPASLRQFTHSVYIAHAGEDKLTIARPLWSRLRSQGISTFLDMEEMQPGGNKELVLRQAMQAAQLCVIILSPEAAAKKWPQIEIEHFLNRVWTEGAYAPHILPVFYRMSIDDCHGYDYFARVDSRGRNLFIKWGFYERAVLGSTSVSKVVGFMRELTGWTGIENKEGATNEDGQEMRRKRERFINQVVQAVATIMMERKARAQVFTQVGV